MWRFGGSFPRVVLKKRLLFYLDDDHKSEGVNQIVKTLFNTRRSRDVHSAYCYIVCFKIFRSERKRIVSAARRRVHLERLKSD